jgi:hypothetical protein
MSNFDLRKYLAEGRLYTEAGGDMQSLPVDPIPGTPQVYSDIADKIIDKLEGFYNSSEFNNIANKIAQSLDDKTKITLVKAVQPKLSGGLENFLRSSVKQSSINEEEEFDLIDYGLKNNFLKRSSDPDSPQEIAEKVAYNILDFIRGFAKANIMSGGMLPALTATAIEYLGGYPAVTALASLLGGPVAALAVSMLGAFIGGILIWKLVDIITDEQTNISPR